MNEADLIKSYELCFAEKGTTYTCAVCPYRRFGELCKVERDKDAFEWFKKYKASIDKCIGIICKKEDMEQLISRERQQYYDELQAKKAEIERLKASASSKCEDCAGCTQWKCDCSNERAAAIEEFVDKIEKQAIPSDDEVYWVALDDIFNLVKEMEGDTE